MTVPVVTWMDSTHTAEITQPFDFGVIEADSKSKVRTFNIWNNRNGDKDVSKMEDCTFTTRDMKGGYDVELVKEHWFHVQVDSLNETDIDDDASKVGKDFSKSIGTTGSTKKDHAGTPLSVPLTPAQQEILGVNNNGDPMDAAGNYVTVSVQADVPLNATSGRQDFKLRVSYRYI